MKRKCFCFRYQEETIRQFSGSYKKDTVVFSLNRKRTPCFKTQQLSTLTHTKRSPWSLEHKGFQRRSQEGHSKFRHRGQEDKAVLSTTRGVILSMHGLHWTTKEDGEHCTSKVGVGIRGAVICAIFHTLLTLPLRYNSYKSSTRV